MSAIQIKSGNRTETVKILAKEGNKFSFLLGEKEYDLDIVKVEKNIYSVLLGNRSFDIEIVPSNGKNSFLVRYICNSYNIEIVDAQLRYMQNRLQSAGGDDENVITCPMPGKIVRVMVKEGDEVEAGQVVVIVSAMKMESEYKSGKNGRIKDVLVNDGDVIDANRPLIILE